MRESTSKIDSISFKMTNTPIDEIIINPERGGLFVFELPAEYYCKLNIHSVKYLVDHGCKGVYVSFQRPTKNISHLFKQFDINKEDVEILDMTSMSSEKRNTSSDDAERIWNKILCSLNKLKCNKKFVFIDSITTMALVKSDFWIDSFSNFLMKCIDNEEFNDVIFLVNVAKDLTDKKIVRDVSSAADGVFNVDTSKSGYSVELVKPEQLT